MSILVSNDIELTSNHIEITLNKLENDQKITDMINLIDVLTNKNINLTSNHVKIILNKLRQHLRAIDLNKSHTGLIALLNAFKNNNKDLDFSDPELRKIARQKLQNIQDEISALNNFFSKQKTTRATNVGAQSDKKKNIINNNRDHEGLENKKTIQSNYDNNINENKTRFSEVVQLLKDVKNRKYIENGKIRELKNKDERQKFKGDVVIQLSNRLSSLVSEYEKKNKSWQNLQINLDDEKKFWIAIGDYLAKTGLLTKQQSQEFQNKYRRHL